MKKDLSEMTGEEMVSLACSLAIAISKKCDKYDLNKIKLFCQSLSSNLTIIEFQNLNKK